MGLNARPLLHPRWKEQAARAASQYQANATIRIFKPNSQLTTGIPVGEERKRFDPKGGQGGNSGQARTQVWPSVGDLEAAPAWVGIISGNTQNAANPATGNAEVNIQIELTKFGPTDMIDFGYQVEVVECESDPRLVGRVIPVKRTATGSVAIERYIFAELPEGG